MGASGRRAQAIGHREVRRDQKPHKESRDEEQGRLLMRALLGSVKKTRTGEPSTEVMPSPIAAARSGGPSEFQRSAIGCQPGACLSTPCATVLCQNASVRPKDNETDLRSTLERLAAFTE